MDRRPVSHQEGDHRLLEQLRRADPTCAQSTCVSSYYHTDQKPALPYVIRTPSKPGSDPACLKQCGNGNTVFGIGFANNLLIEPLVGMKITVPKPWFVRFSPWDDPESYCLSGAESQRAVTDNVATTARVLTNDPNAPAVNAIVEKVSWPATCP